MGMEKSVKFVVQLLTSDDCVTLMARGTHSKAELIAEAIAQEEIDTDDQERFEKGEFSNSRWFKAVPRPGYSTYYYSSREGVRGAFKATCIQYAW